MKNTPIERHLIDETINEFQIVDFSKATIREVKAIASKAEAASGVEFIKMEMGIPVRHQNDIPSALHLPLPSLRYNADHPQKVFCPMYKHHR